MLIFFGCAESKKVEKDLFYEKWKVLAEESKGYSPVAKRRAIDIPGRDLKKKSGKKKITIYKKSLPTKRITLKIHNTGLDTLLRSLARVVDQNILINDKIKGSVSINVKKARWDQLFQGILASHGLTYVWEGEIIRVMTIEDLEQELKRETQKKDLRMIEPLMTKIISIDYADAEKLRNNLEKFLSVGKTGKSIGSVMVDEHSNALVIQAIRDDIARMIPMIEELDKPTLQILIEAHIVETSKETARELGVQWGGLVLKDGGVSHYITPGMQGSGGLGGSLGTAIDPTSGMVSNFPAVLEETAGFSIGLISENVGNSILSIQLSALQKEGKLNILSSPSITTLDNQVAMIESGEEVPYQTVENDEVKIEFKKAVLSLEVEPHVIGGETIKMRIKTSKDEINFSYDVMGNPTISTKKAETNVILLDGQTTVIGGLNKETKSDSESGVPWLKDIPLLGALFRSSSKSNSMEEVLIFITPHILKEKIEEESPAIIEGEEFSQDSDALSHSKPIIIQDSVIIGDEKPYWEKNVQESDFSILGQVTVAQHDTLGEMIKTVYGVYSLKYQQILLQVNPHINNQDVIDVGEIVSFPAISVTVNPIIKDARWIKLDATDTLENAFRMVRSYPDNEMPIRMIPYFNERAGLQFAIVLSELFFNESAAKDRLSRLHSSVASKATVSSLWEEGTVYFADPALMN